MRERERSQGLAASQPQSLSTAVLPVIAAVPSRTAVLAIMPEQAEPVVASYAELLNTLVAPTSAAPLTSADAFINAATSADAQAAEAAEASTIRRARRAAAVEADLAPTAAPVAPANPNSRRAARSAGSTSAVDAGTANVRTAGANTSSAGVFDVTSLPAGAAQANTVHAGFGLTGFGSGAFEPSVFEASAPQEPQVQARAHTPHAAPTGGTSMPRATASAATAPRMTLAAPGRSLASRIATKTTVVVAMGFVALMAVATSVPAEALLTADDVKAAALVAKMPSRTEPGQSVVARGGDSITVQADGYETATIAEAAAASGIRMEATFVNNPAGAVQWPFAVGVHVGDRFGYRDCAGCSSNHGGQDFNPGNGAEIQSIADGVVTIAEDGEGSLGVHMMIEHQIDGKTVTSVYAHMQHGTMRFNTGDVVKVGQVIGNTGTTGMSTGPHLHFEIRLGGINGTKVDPLDWLYANTN